MLSYVTVNPSRHFYIHWTSLALYSFKLFLLLYFRRICRFASDELFAVHPSKLLAWKPLNFSLEIHWTFRITSIHPGFSAHSTFTLKIWVRHSFRITSHSSKCNQLKFISLKRWMRCKDRRQKQRGICMEGRKMPSSES